MKRVSLVLLLLGGALGLFGAAARAVDPQNPSFKKVNNPAVTNLASLAGCWKGTGPGGMSAKVSFELAGDGTSLVEYLEPGNFSPMYTVYYLDGETPMALHFCSYGNQVRMKAEPSTDPKVVNFKFVDATNLANPDANHMNYAKFTIRDRNHFDVEWGRHLSGKDTPQPFVFTRVVGKSCTALRNANRHG